jgi:hypothetical protein
VDQYSELLVDPNLLSKPYFIAEDYSSLNLRQVGLKFGVVDCFQSQMCMGYKKDQQNQ